jgi:aspartate aminotransferase
MNIMNKLISPYLRASKQSDTLLINQQSINRENNNETVYKFGFGQSPFPVPSTITKALSNAAHRKEYMNVQGDLKLRQAIVDFHLQQEGKNWRAENIIIGSGSKILLFCIMAAFEKAEILLPAPSWVSYEPQGELAGHNVYWLTTSFDDQWLLTPQQLEQFCQNRINSKTPLILVLNYPSNPSGQTYNNTQLKALARIMDKYNIIVIADEIYSLLSYNKSTACSLAHFYPQGTIVSSGLSKWCGAGGWRLGFIHIPGQLSSLLNTVIGVASETYSCAPSPVQIAAIEAYSDLALADNFLSQQINILAKISHYCCATLKSSGLKVHSCKGGFYLFPDFSAYSEKLAKRGIKTSQQLTQALMTEANVALLPGSAFGMKENSLTTRLAFVDFDGQQALLQTESDFEFTKIKEGITKICLWLTRL